MNPPVHSLERAGLKAAPVHDTARRWAVAVFASRESGQTLDATVRAALAACPQDTGVSVLINGNEALALHATGVLAQGLAATGADRLRIWSIDAADKSNAWNRYVHDIWRGEEVVFFIDGYVRLQSDALRRLGDATLASAGAFGGSGVPLGGRRSAALQAEMLARGGFHGNFCCMRRAALEALKRRRILLPVGLYRCDALLGAMLRFGFDTTAGRWDRTRIVVEPGAGYRVDAKHWWRPRDIAAALRRTLRQARGQLENDAVRSYLVTHKLPPESLPGTATALVTDWASTCPGEFRAALRANPLCWLAYRKLRQPPPAHGPSLAARLRWPEGGA